ncbi:MAG: hypothetical protein LBQ77_00365 [Treponema sp.]|jgi:hypothetical protein|nr:hypothetical protein [Treponema sp.]
MLNVTTKTTSEMTEEIFNEENETEQTVLEPITEEPEIQPKLSEKLYLPADYAALRFPLNEYTDVLQIRDLKATVGYGNPAEHTNVLIFLTATHATTYLMFSRLAAYTEHIRYHGDIQAVFEHIAPTRRVYNANDFSIDSLARFYTDVLAFHLEDQLTAEERMLFSIVYDEGWINDAIQPTGIYAVIQVSMENPLPSRRSLLSHEWVHAIFFVFPDIKDETVKLYRSYTAEHGTGQFFNFLGAMRLSYNTSDELLMANEFAAYLLQEYAELRQLIADAPFITRMRDLYKNYL